MRTRTTTLVTIAAIALCAIAPVSARAADGAPDVAVDPPAAVDPGPVAPAPADPTPAVEPTNPVVTAEGGDVVVADAAGIADGTPTAPAAHAPTAATASAPAPSGSGSLPFTGVVDGQMLLVLLVGSLLVTGGLTSWSWARAASHPG
jgi:hypothetical protein